MPMREYLTKMKSYCDLPKAACRKVSDMEHVLSIINALDKEYEVLVAVI